MMKTSVYLGLDVGATSTSAVGVDDDGQVLASHCGAGANAFADPEVHSALENTLRVMLDLLAETGTNHKVSGMVLGVAGSLARPDVRAQVDDVVTDMSIGSPWLVVNDAEVMFATGSAATDGHCLAVGTGSIGVAIRQGRVSRTVDGHGWMLGDVGSAVWIGIRAIRAILAALEGSGEDTSLVGEGLGILEDLSGHPCPRDPVRIVTAAHSIPPSALGQVARVVDVQARSGDAVARTIIDEASEALADTLTALVDDRGALPIVLGGSIPYHNATIRRHLERVATSHWPDAPLRVVESGAPGAALWAMRQAGRPVDELLLQKVREATEPIG